MVSQTDLNLFVDELIEAKGLEDAEPEALSQLKQDLRGRLTDRVNLAILENLPMEQMGELEKLFKNKASSEEVRNFCLVKINNLPEVITSTLSAFKNTYING